MNFTNFVIKLIHKYGWKPKAKVYKALLTQISNNAPVAIVLENTLGGEVVWTRDEESFYSGTISVPISDNVANLTDSSYMSINGAGILTSYVNNSIISISSFEIDGTIVGVEMNTAIPITVYIEVYPE